jgi:hypothetical protein
MVGNSYKQAIAKMFDVNFTENVMLASIDEVLKEEDKK